MSHRLPRRDVLLSIPACALLAPRALGQDAARSAPPVPPLPYQDPALVRAMVAAAHGNMEKVRELLARLPELAKATIDWGFGDWESAIGAAAHTGRREIAVLLMEHGARPDIFTLAMLGHLEAVKSMVNAIPGVQRTLGPHGLSLAHHARAGGEPARATLDYLLSLGDADATQGGAALTAEQRAVYTAEFRTSGGQRVVISEERERLQIRVDEHPPRPLHSSGEHAFHPAGAPSVTIRVQVQDQRASGLTIEAGERIAEASRV